MTDARELTAQRVEEIRQRLSAYEMGDPDPLQDNAADDVRFLLTIVHTLGPASSEQP